MIVYGISLVVVFTWLLVLSFKIKAIKNYEYRKKLAEELEGLWNEDKLYKVAVWAPKTKNVICSDSMLGADMSIKETKRYIEKALADKQRAVQSSLLKR